LFVSWAAFTAYFMPRVFAGSLMVYSSSRSEGGWSGIPLVPLAPNSTNFTQAVYVVVGWVVFACTRALASQPDGARWILRALYVTAALNALFVVMDAVGALGRVETGLSYIKNANYAKVSQYIGSWPRLQGAFPEPAALAFFATGLFSCLLSLWILGVEPRKTGPLAVLTGSTLILTFSSTALLSLSLMVGLALVAVWARQVSAARKHHFGWQAALGLVVVVIACLMALWSPAWLDRFFDIAHKMIFHKIDSQSGQERMAWAMGTLNNFLDTYGLGAGAGSARGSSWPLVVLGNTGALGMIAVLGFLATCLFRSAGALSPRDSHVLIGVRLGFVGALVAASISGTMLDPGAFFFALAGACAGLAMREPANQAEVSPQSVLQTVTA
jgi:hypothetical protein